MLNIQGIQQAIREESLQGWLFYGFHHRDDISDRILGLSKERVNSRPWYCLVYPQGEPDLILHAIEPRILDHIPGRRHIYSGREKLKEILSGLPKGRIAAQISVNIPVISFLDYGTARLFEDAGYTLTGSESLIQRYLGLLSEEEYSSHKRAALHLYEIVETVWERISRKLKSSEHISEGRIQQWIMDEISDRGCYTEHPPIVAAGNHSGDPHYSPEGEGSPLIHGQVLQLDLWAKEKTEEGIYADISWVGVLKDSPSAEEETVFSAVVGARERGVEFIENELSKAAYPKGMDVDKQTRAFLMSAGFGDFLCHRTGHGIDREVHGYGANLDSVEFPDSRLLLPGSCFSIEPGIYRNDFGMRTEINGNIRGNKLEISGKARQFKLLTL